jgi:CDGSH-type Zn-finger protein
METNKIKITKNGPYLVTGNIKLEELIIEETEKGNIYKQGKVYAKSNKYLLCRCGKSKNMPFCDGSHMHNHFDGTLTASKEPFTNQAKIYYGNKFILEDVENLCAFARFCHSPYGDAWEMAEIAETKDEEALAVKLCTECPSGRLVLKERETNQEIEPVFEPSISILQDPSRDCSGPLWVRGGITIEDDNGYIYEKRNRVTLCRCGKSSNKPFCDAIHVNIKFKDK